MRYYVHVHNNNIIIHLLSGRLIQHLLAVYIYNQTTIIIDEWLQSKYWSSWTDIDGEVNYYFKQIAEKVFSIHSTRIIGPSNNNYYYDTHLWQLMNMLLTGGWICKNYYLLSLSLSYEHVKGNTRQ